MAAQNYPTTGRKVSAFNTPWLSLFDTRLKDGYIADTEIYGRLSYIFDAMTISGRTLNLDTRKPKIFQKLNWEKTVKLESPISTGAAGAAISIVVSTDDRDANGNVPIQTGDTVMISSVYQNTGKDMLYVITAYDSGTFTATGTPLLADGSGGLDQAQISVEVPAGTTLTVATKNFGLGTGQPGGSTFVRSEIEFKNQIIKTNLTIEGGANAIAWRDVSMQDGSAGLVIEGQEYQELEHSKAVDGAMFFGQENDNAALTAVSNSGGTNKIPGTKGLWEWGLSDGQSLTYSGGWASSNFYDYKDLALVNLLASKDVSMMCGTDLLRSVEESNLDFTKEYSGGTDLYDAMYNTLGFAVKHVTLNGYTFHIQELASWANPNRFGNKDLEFSKRGIMMPTGGSEMIEFEGGAEKHPTWMVGYLNAGGVDRTRVMRIIDGMSGTTATASNGFDEIKYEMLSEIFNLVFRPNQVTLIDEE